MSYNQWQFISTLVNLGTFSRVGDVVQAQERLSTHLIGKEIQSQHDNALLSQLVDIYVKVGELTKDDRFFDALISSVIGLSLYRDSYQKIVDATTKMKAAEISVKLRSGTEEVIANSQANGLIAKSLSSFMTEIVFDIENAIAEMTAVSYRFRWLGLAHDRKLGPGEELFAVNNAYDQHSRVLLFQEGNSYEIIQFDNRYKEGIVLISEIGRNHVIFRGRNGGYDRFCILEPPLPNLRIKLSAWEAVKRAFGDEFISANLKQSAEKLTAVREKAERMAGKTIKYIEERINAYHSNRKLLIQKYCLKPKERQRSQETSFDKWFFVGLVAIALYLVLSNLKC